jgi:hypothetical protein
MAGPVPRTVVHFSSRPGDHPGRHESASRAWVAERLSRLLGYDYGGAFDAAGRYPVTPYFVPGETLLEDEARPLGIRDEHDLFGGVVPRAFLATKAIAHPVIDGGQAPAGWSRGLGFDLGDAVLRGYTAFNAGDARRAGRRLLEAGPARVKRGDGIAGRGQTVVNDVASLDAAIADIDAQVLAEQGVVIEENLEDVTTFSVGRVVVGEQVATYVGTQHATLDNHGQETYGGSDLVVVRGDYDLLLALQPESAFRRAVEDARAFDAAVSKAYPGLFASRRNYDSVYGRDAQGRTRIGLLEQSWRVGGASPAEIAALEAFQADPGVKAVRACCVEVYGEGVVPPAGASAYFAGIDERVGGLTKYVYVKDHGIPP